MEEMYKSKKKPQKESPQIAFIRKRREEQWEQIKQTENARKGDK